MRRATYIIAAAAISLGSIVSAKSEDFEFKSGGNCSSHEPWKPDKLTVKREHDGTVRARIVFNSQCVFDENFSPHVEFLEGVVKLQVERNRSEITPDCSCTNKITFILKRPVPPGTVVVFGYDSDEPHLRSVAP